MKYLLLLLVPFVFSCQEEEKEQPKLLSYTEKLFQQEDLSINLPQINNGEYFFENDSTLYLNVFILNDSTIKFNDTTFNLSDSNSSFDYYMIRNIGVDSTKDFSPEAVVKDINSFVNSNKEKNIEFSLFCNSTISYKTLSAFYHHIFMLSLNDVNAINLFGANNQFVSVNYSKYFHNDVIACFWESSIFEILVNKNKQIMIENDWDLSFNEIKPRVMIYYTNPNNDENLPELVEVNEKICNQQIALLKKFIEDGDSSKIDKLKEWQAKLLNVSLLAAYKTLPRRTFIFIQSEKANKYTTYLSTVDSISGGVMELKNNFCMDRFGREYSKLNTNLYIDYQIKLAIDEVYPNKINSSTYFTLEIPPPPPPPAP